MNYKTLLTDTDIVQGRNFTLRRFDRAAAIELNSTERYLVLFVLFGKLDLFSNRSEYCILAGEMALADQQQFCDMFCSQGTILLEYYLPEALTRRFALSFTAYCTPKIPITGRLDEWVAKLLSSESWEAEAEALVGLLLKYQSRKLKSLCGPMKEYVATLK